MNEQNQILEQSFKSQASGISKASSVLSKEEFLNVLDEEMNADEQILNQSASRLRSSIVPQANNNNLGSSQVDLQTEQYIRQTFTEGRQVDLSKFPNADFYYKMVAKINGFYFSIYEADCQYKINEIKYQKVLPDKKGGYFVYRELESAIFADIVFNYGGNFTAPRTILKCICWGDNLRYGLKRCFSFIVPVADLGLPVGYKANAKECYEQAIKERQKRIHQKMEIKYDLGLVRMNNFSREQYENNIFENYFSASVIRQVEQALLQDRIQAEIAQDDDEDNYNQSFNQRNERDLGASRSVRFQQLDEVQESPLRGLVSDVENRYR